MKYVYSGAFDPITKAHTEIIKNITKHLAADDELYVLISDIDMAAYSADFNNRYEMVNSTLKAVFNDKHFKILKFEQCIWFFLKQTFSDDHDVTIVVSEDEWNALLDGKLVHYEDLYKNYNFLVFKREGDRIRKPPSVKCMKSFNIKNVSTISSSKIRAIFDLNPDTKYKEIQDMIHLKTFKNIKENGLYYQNGDKYYEEECPEKLKLYQAQKTINNWSEPSITTDVVAYNGDKVLLIRRANWPYRYFWALPGGFWEKTDVDLDAGAAREFKEETMLDYDRSKFKQIKAYGHDFDPRMKICDVAFAVRIHKEDMKKAIGSDDAAEARWFKLSELPPLAFHHRQIIDDWMAMNNDE